MRILTCHCKVVLFNTIGVMGRAWQLFDWVRMLPEGHEVRRLCDADTYTTMIALCGPWHQLRRALQLVADMRARSLPCGAKVHFPNTAFPLHYEIL